MRRRCGTLQGMENELERPDDHLAAPTDETIDEAGVPSGPEGPSRALDERPLGLDEAQAEALAASLLWRIGRAYEDGPVTVRVGLASAAPLFAELSRLRAATDQEVEAAVHEGDVQVEWVGPRLVGRS